MVALLDGGIARGDWEARRVSDPAELCRLTAAAIAGGDVAGWFQGRMEWGPRALGNRSIVCDPRRGDMVEKVNRKIKRRESFRPFAPAVQREHAADWFEEDGEVPFMSQVSPVREEKRCLIPAVTHVDGTARLQTVCHSANPRFWQLIEAFRGITGVPMVLNTSFNESEPIVCHPAEALDCFERTGLDLLVLGDWLVNRRKPDD
jgi:carbamoyltransferase